MTVKSHHKVVRYVPIIIAVNVHDTIWACRDIKIIIFFKTALLLYNYVILRYGVRGDRSKSKLVNQNMELLVH